MEVCSLTLTEVEGGGGWGRFLLLLLRECTSCSYVRIGMPGEAVQLLLGKALRIQCTKINIVQGPYCGGFV